MPAAPDHAALPPGLAPRLAAFCEELRGEGVAVGTAELLDAFEALEAVPWTEPADFRDAMRAEAIPSLLRLQPEQLRAIGARLGSPVFVRGTVRITALPKGR